MSQTTDLKQLARQVKSGEIKAVDLVAEALKQAKASSALNIFIEIFEDLASKKAEEIDKRVASGEKLGKLAGIPFVLKDNFLVDFGKTTAASNMLKNFSAPYSATAVKKILEQDAILIGKVNLDAFAHGTSTENSDFGPTRNPHDPSRVPGGSSGGSAAAVAAGIVPFALGTDTGGSIRLPASFCGVVGFKPTYGLVSRYGVVAMASSTDCIGPLTVTASDAAYLTEIIKGRDQYDGTTIDSTNIDTNISLKKKLKIGVIEEFSQENLSEEVRQAFNSAVDQLKQKGHTLESVSIPSIDQALACYYVIVPAEVSSNLSRYDGLRYGHQSSSPKNLDEQYLKNRSQGFNDENKRRIMIGTYVLSSGYYDAYYKKAQQLRTKLINEFTTVFEKYDLVISPVAPFTAFELGAKVDDVLQMYMADIMTVSANLVGVPAVSVPLQKIKELPIGLQIMGQQKDDGLVLALAKQVEGF